MKNPACESIADESSPIISADSPLSGKAVRHRDLHGVLPQIRRICRIFPIYPLAMRREI